MKKRISKNIFHFSHLIIKLKKEKRKKKKLFAGIYYFDISTLNPASIFLFPVNYETIKNNCRIYLKLTVDTRIASLL